jgi:beta-lactam-binding protein with PASTA domain
VPLLDGKYEIHGEAPGGVGVTEFTATDPDGVAVRVEWFELAADEEAGFERYRRLIKRLAREERAAVRDVVSRPGARYVAWYLPPESTSAGRDAALCDAIEEAGFDPTLASIRRVATIPTLFALPFRQRSEAPPTSIANLPPPSHPWGRWWTDATRTWLLSGALTLGALSALAAGLALRHNDRVVAVQAVLGLPYAEAAERLYRDGLRVGLRTIAADDHLAGVVFDSNPAVGERLRPGREVMLSVAIPSGQLAPSEVPRVVGLSLDATFAALERAGLAVGSQQRVHLDTPAGLVVAQTPPALTTVGEGARVDLVVSLGPRPAHTFLPNLVGLPLTEALSLATLAGLTPSQVVLDRTSSSAVSHETVLAQSLAPHRDLPLTGTTLRLVVAEGVAPPQRTAGGLPALGGMSEEQAREIAHGFDIRVQYLYDAQLPNGVVAQSLPLGAEPGDAQLVLTVNTQPMRVPRPEIQVEVRTPEPRVLAYLWFIEPGILRARAEVTATTLEGVTVTVWEGETQGGSRVAGGWETDYPGVVHFDLTLNGIAYGGSLRAP